MTNPSTTRSSLEGLIARCPHPAGHDAALRSRAETAEAELRWIAEHDLRYTERIRTALSTPKEDKK